MALELQKPGAGFPYIEGNAFAENGAKYADNKGFRTCQLCTGDEIEFNFGMNDKNKIYA